MSDKQKKRRKRFHKELAGFDIKVNPFGELESSFDVNKINAFLNEKVDDKKLRDRDNLPTTEEEE
jgi:hypothetical protein